MIKEKIILNTWKIHRFLAISSEKASCKLANKERQYFVHSRENEAEHESNNNSTLLWVYPLAVRFNEKRGSYSTWRYFSEEKILITKNTVFCSKFMYVSWYKWKCHLSEVRDSISVTGVLFLFCIFLNNLIFNKTDQTTEYLLFDYLIHFIG